MPCVLFCRPKARGWRVICGGWINTVKLGQFCLQLRNSRISVRLEVWQWWLTNLRKDWFRWVLMLLWYHLFMISTSKGRRITSRRIIFIMNLILKLVRVMGSIKLECIAANGRIFSFISCITVSSSLSLIIKGTPNISLSRRLFLQRDVWNYAATRRFSPLLF